MLDPQDESRVKDAEIIDDESTPQEVQTPQDGDALVTMNLESMIKKNISNTTKMREELTKYKEMLNDTLANDPIYLEHEEKAKEANKLKSKVKSEILKRPETADVANKVKALSSEIRENSQQLSEYLREFQRISGINEIEDESGELLEIVYTAKLKKKSS